jgi:hypothetical protein
MLEPSINRPKAATAAIWRQRSKKPSPLRKVSCRMTKKYFNGFKYLIYWKDRGMFATGKMGPESMRAGVSGNVPVETHRAFLVNSRNAGMARFA